MLNILKNYSNEIRAIIRLILFLVVITTMIPPPISDCSERYEFWGQFIMGCLALIPFLFLLENIAKLRILALICGILGYAAICYIAVSAWNMNIGLTC
ncbi:MAG: hypothetical protein FD128_1116 [Hyphomonadaceae bacterium]|nr:MAG: hypothetical protein FD128_1116 [Hyphomonadaceae bacterium]